MPQETLSPQVVASEQAPRPRRHPLFALVLTASLVVALLAAGAVVALWATSSGHQGRSPGRAQAGPSAPTPPETPSPAPALRPTSPPGEAAPQAVQPPLGESTPTRTLEVSLAHVPDDAEVTFNGRPVEQGLLRGELGEEGELVVKADGYHELRQRVQLLEASVIDLDELLERLEPTPRSSGVASAGRRRPTTRTTTPASSPPARWPPPDYRPAPSAGGGIVRDIPASGPGIVRNLK